MIYFVSKAGDTPSMKVGFSAEPLRRVQALQADCPEELALVLVVEGSRADAKALHQQLSARRITGEWFDLTVPQALQLVLGMGCKQIPLDQLPPPKRRGPVPGARRLRPSDDPVQAQLEAVERNLSKPFITDARREKLEWDRLRLKNRARRSRHAQKRSLKAG